MSSGPVGENLSYWAAIRISKPLKKEDLQAVVQQINAILNKNDGAIVTETRASSKSVLSFSLRAPDGNNR
jgi:hypothetical protein